MPPSFQLKLRTTTMPVTRKAANKKAKTTTLQTKECTEHTIRETAKAVSNDKDHNDFEAAMMAIQPGKRLFRKCHLRKKEIAVGMKIDIFWPGNRQWYACAVLEREGDVVSLGYSYDGSEETVDLNKVVWRAAISREADDGQDV